MASARANGTDQTSDALSVVSLVIVVCARWSLARNMGLVPARRTALRSAHTRMPSISGHEVNNQMQCSGLAEARTSADDCGHGRARH